MEMKIGDAKYINRYLKIEDITLNTHLVFFGNSFIQTDDINVIHDMVEHGLECHVTMVNSVEKDSSKITIGLRIGKIEWEPFIKPFGMILGFIPYKNEEIEGEISVYE